MHEGGDCGETESDWLQHAAGRDFPTGAGNHVDTDGKTTETTSVGASS